MAHDQQRWIEELALLRRAQTPCALVTVVGITGSTPRDVGARMIVTTESLAFGTIGGGRLEHLAMERARELLHGAIPCTPNLDLPLAERAGQCCGGQVSLLIEVFVWQARQVAVFGAGHVGQALGGLAPWMGADVVLIDSRSEETLEPKLPAEPAFRLLFSAAPEAELEELSPDACVLIMTHDHALDLALLEAALKRPFPYIGLIGSERKWQRFRGRLTQRGMDSQQFERVHCPIGGARPSKEPGAIALAAAAEILSVLSSIEALGEPGVPDYRI